MSAVLRARGTSRLASVGRGFAQPVHAAQRVFRVLLEATARPGRIQTLPATALAGVEPPGWSIGLTALLLTLLDAETSVWIEPALSGSGAPDYLRFHTGVVMPTDPAEAAFAVWDASRVQPAIWSALNAGTDEAPQTSATLMIEVPSLRAPSAAWADTRLCLRGPGVESTQRLVVGGLAPPFWKARSALEDAYPRGIDVILCCGDTFAAIPRTTCVTVEG